MNAIMLIADVMLLTSLIILSTIVRFGQHQWGARGALDWAFLAAAADVRTDRQ